MSGFYASFAARHPSRDLSDFLLQLGVASKHCYQAGEKRRTPTGLLLDGTYDSSYYSCDLPLSASDDLAEWLGQAVDFLRPMVKSFVSFADDGGSLSFFIGLEKGVFEGTALPPKLLAELGALQISIDIDRNL